MASNLKSAKNDNGRNATPEIIAADEYRDLIRGKRNEIAAGLDQLYKVTSGDAAYETVRGTTKEISLPLDKLALWNPAVPDNAIEKVVVETQNDIAKPDRQPRTFDAYSKALLAAVCASDKDTADSARIGKGTEAKPQYGYVRKRAFTAVGAAKANAFEGNQADAAKLITDNLAAYKNDPDMLDIWKQASDAVNNEINLRAMGAKLAAIGVAVGRYRAWLFASVCGNKLDAFATEDNLTTVGRVWLPALSAAKRAHGDYIKDRSAKGEPIVVADLGTAINAAVDEVLEKHRGVKGRVVLDDDEQAKQLRAKLYRVLNECDKMWSGFGLEDLVSFEVNRKSDELFLDGPYNPKNKAHAERIARLTGATGEVDATRQDKAKAETADQDAAKAKRREERSGTADSAAAKAALAKGNKPTPKTSDAAKLAALAKIKDK